MKIAIQFGAGDRTADPGRIAHEAEARGFEGIFFPEHTHVPVDHVDFPYAGSEHRLNYTPRFLSPWVSMAWAASTTKKLKVGTCVALPAQHDAINLAKVLASLDLMTGGRVVYGFGFGWCDEEMADHGVDPKRRRATTRERMLAVDTLWSNEQASFSGEFVNFKPCFQWPKSDRARTPLLLGAQGSDQVFDHVIEYCDGWMPSARGDFLGGVARLRERAQARGRDPKTIEIDVISAQRSVELFTKFQEAGVDRVILHTPYAEVDEVLRTLDSYAEEFLSEFPGSGPD